MGLLRGLVRQRSKATATAVHAVANHSPAGGVELLLLGDYVGGVILFMVRQRSKTTAAAAVVHHSPAGGV